MPELPEVERARAFIEEHGLGRRIAAVDDSDTYVCRPHMPGELAGALTGRFLLRAERIGKALFCTTSEDGPTLGLHLGMAGSIVADVPALERAPQWDRFVLEFEDGGRLALRDRRRLGRAVLEPDLSGLGPDAERIGRDAFRSRVGTGTAPLKARIMDQSVLAGVGNLLADEALWRARLSPLKPAGDVTVEELDRLRRALRASIRDAIALGGVHKGRVIPYRARGQRCPRCRGEMVRETIGGRTTWWCAREQK